MDNSRKEAHQAGRLRAIRWAQWLLESGFVIFDTETTGLGRTAEIVQIGIVDNHGHAVMNQLLRPQGPIDPGASRIHGITDEQVSDAPTFPEVYDSLRAIMANRIIVAYNADFDRKMLYQTCMRYDLPMISPNEAQWTCAMKNFAQFQGTINPHQSALWNIQMV